MENIDQKIEWALAQLQRTGDRISNKAIASLLGMDYRKFLRSITPEMKKKLQSFGYPRHGAVRSPITECPHTTPDILCINTLDLDGLSKLPGLNIEQAKRIREGRRDKPYKTWGEVRKAIGRIEQQEWETLIQTGVRLDNCPFSRVHYSDGVCNNCRSAYYYANKAGTRFAVSVGDRDKIKMPYDS